MVSRIDTMSRSRGQKDIRGTLRAKNLQSMVKFDAASHEIIHMDSYEYEKYIAVMFATKLFQATTQTNDDGLEEEVQTEKQELSSKWTQCPPKWSTMGVNTNSSKSKQEILGVGSQEDGEDGKIDSASLDRQLGQIRNTAILGKFMSKAGKLMLSVLEYKRRTRVPGVAHNVSGANNSSVGILAEQKMILDRGLNVMKNLKMHAVTAYGDTVACSNGHDLEESQEGPPKKNTSKNLITVWSLKEPSMPLYFLRVWGKVNVLKVYPLSHLVVSGNMDGSLNFWNLKEPAQYHTQYQEQVIRTPSVNTSCMPQPNHSLPVQGVEIVPESKSSSLIVSADKEKYIICWSCLTISEADLNQNATINHSTWSRIRVTVRNVISLENVFATPSMSIFSLHVWKNDSANFVVGTNAGFIGIGTLNEEVPIYQKCFIGQNIILNVLSVHRNQLMGLIVGTCDDEYVRIFDLRRKRSILSLESGGEGVPIRVLWSNIRECLLYVAQSNRIEAWDLLSSDLAPVKVIPIANVKDFTVFPWGDQELIVCIASNEANVFNVPLNLKPMDEKEKIRFRRYISII